MSLSQKKAAWVQDALKCAPVVFELEFSDQEDERRAFIASLTDEARKAMLEIMRAHICDEGCDLDIRGLTHHMRTYASVDNDSWPHSDDWRLRIFQTGAGTLYDFNGWPGDNESGGARFYPSGLSGIEPFDVFTNTDSCLEPADAAFLPAVNDYCERRNADGDIANIAAAEQHELLNQRLRRENQHAAMVQRLKEAKCRAALKMLSRRLEEAKRRIAAETLRKEMDRLNSADQ